MRWQVIGKRQEDQTLPPGCSGHNGGRTMLKMPRRTRRSYVAALVAAALIGGTLPASAAAYWDWSGFINPGNWVAEGVPYAEDLIWQYRLSRNNCNAKAYLRYRDTTSYSSLSFSGGCSDGDESWGFARAGYDRCHAVNEGASDVYVNFRCDETV